MFRYLLGATALLLPGLSVLPAAAADLPRPAAHKHKAVHYRAPQVVYGGAVAARRAPYNYEDNGRYDGADVPPPGQQASWLDGYGTRPVVYGAYGTYNVYGGSAQVMPWGLPAAGGLAVYEPGAYGPGPTIIRVPPGY